MNSRQVMLVGFSLLIGLVVGVVVAKFVLGNQSWAAIIPGQAKQNTFFNQQLAQVTGKISRVDGKKITVTNQSGQSQTLSLADRLLIYRPTSLNREVATSSSPQDLPLNQNVSINLLYQNNEYLVIAVSVVPPLPLSLPSSKSSPSASKK